MNNHANPDNKDPHPHEDYAGLKRDKDSLVWQSEAQSVTFSLKREPRQGPRGASGWLDTLAKISPIGPPIKNNLCLIPFLFFIRITRDFEWEALDAETMEDTITMTKVPVRKKENSSKLPDLLVSSGRKTSYWI